MMTPLHTKLIPLSLEMGISPTIIEEVYSKAKMIIEPHEQIDAGSNELHTGSTIRTFTGKYINVFNPREEDIAIEDIAHGLSHACRFAGHTYKFYSVAQHCLDVMDRAPKEFKLQALMHDASEAYLGDMARPIKRHMVKYKHVEYRLMEVIAKTFKLPYPFSEVVKLLDHEVLEWEHDHIILKRDAYALAPHVAKEKFLQAYYLHQNYGA